MSSKRLELIKKIYDFDSNAFIISISIKQYTDVFNQLDPSPLRKRDIDHALQNYLDNCSMDIPLKYNLCLQINCPKEIEDYEKEKRVKRGLNTYFTLMMLAQNREMGISYKNAIFYLFLFILLIPLSIWLSSWIVSNIITETMLEGLSIGGWVFLWEAIAIIVFRTRAIRFSYKKFERLEKAVIKFVYIKNMKIE